jgi:hypothetical protein
MRQVLVSSSSKKGKLLGATRQLPLLLGRMKGLFRHKGCLNADPSFVMWAIHPGATTDAKSHHQKATCPAGCKRNSALAATVEQGD